MRTALGIGVLLLGYIGPRMPSASADYVSEDAMRNDPSESNRSTFVHDPGVHELLDRGDLLAQTGLYAHFGFKPNFLWYAPEVRRVVSASTGWSTCKKGSHGIGEACPTDDVETQGHSIGTTFGGDTELHLFEFGGSFIGKACGNFTTAHLPGDAPTPIPAIAGTKFHDANRNGTRDPGEPGLSGWRIVITRLSSQVGQSQGVVVGQLQTDANGRYRFDLDGHGPGTYAVSEVLLDGWNRTTPASRQVVVDPGIGAPVFDDNDFGNYGEADTGKAGFGLVDPPTELQADTPHELVVRAVLRNEGPVRVVEVDDVLSVSGPEDCTVSPPAQSVRRRVEMGDAVVVDFSVHVLCTEPSDHPFEFRDTVTLRTPGVTELDGSDNVRSFVHSIPVIDKADLRLQSVSLDCATRGDVGLPFVCASEATVANAGPYEVPNADVTLNLAAPPDCDVSPTVTHADVVVPLGEERTLAGAWQVVCADRSFHPMSVTADVELDHLHVVETNPSNDTAGASDMVEVFEPVDLLVQPMRVACGERAFGPGSFECRVTVTVANVGPATGVATSTAVALTGPADCTVVPGAQVDETVIDAGESTTFVKAWQVACSATSRHTFTASATVVPNEPHAEEYDHSNDTARVRWTPIDVKPHSDPSSINLRKQGVVPVAILSTPHFDAPGEVDVTTLRFGATGTEDSLVSCSPTPEDVNDDGLLDLVCHFDTTLTGLTCQSGVAVLTGFLRDDTPIEGQDDVKVTPC